jgi:DNA replication protein DnaC
LLSDLAVQDSALALRRRLHRHVKPDLLVIDEIGYLSYADCSADLPFEVISRRYQHTSTIITTNRAFSDWTAIFPNATCVVTLVDRLCHRAEIVQIEGDSYRLKEAKDRAARRAPRRPKPPDLPSPTRHPRLADRICRHFSSAKLGAS